MDDILQFVALETIKTRRGFQTTLTFTPAAIDLIKETYEVNPEDAIIIQNEDVFEDLEEEELEIVNEMLSNQMICENFIINEMGIDDCIEMIGSANSKGEIKMIVLTEKETGYL